MWAAITYDGPAALVFVDEKMNTDKYEETLRTALPQIPKLMDGSLTF